MTTIEGLVSDVLRDLELDQPVRKVMDAETHSKIEVLCDKLRVIIGEEKTEDGDVIPSDQTTLALEGNKNERSFPAFSLRVDDPSGNSFVEFFGGIQEKGTSDVKWSKRDYNRSKEQNDKLGLAGPADGSNQKQQTTEELSQGFKNEETEFENEEIFSFDGTCSSCNSILQTNMKKVNIPYFKVSYSLCSLSLLHIQSMFEYSLMKLL